MINDYWLWFLSKPFYINLRSLCNCIQWLYLTIPLLISIRKLNDCQAVIKQMEQLHVHVQSRLSSSRLGFYCIPTTWWLGRISAALKILEATRNTKRSQICFICNQMHNIWNRNINLWKDYVIGLFIIPTTFFFVPASPTLWFQWVVVYNISTTCLQLSQFGITAELQTILSKLGLFWRELSFWETVAAMFLAINFQIITAVYPGLYFASALLDNFP